MKVLLLTNNIKWKSLDSRIPKLEKYLEDSLYFMHPKVKIDRKNIKKDVQIGSHINHIDQLWFRGIYSKYNKYDAVGMVITKKDWIKAGGRKDLGGFYIINADTQHQFYIICDENSTTKRRGKRLKEFEEYIEHEIAGHGMQFGLGFYDVNNTDKYIKGKDNTHFFFYNDTKENYYKDLKKDWENLSAKLGSKIQKIKDMIVQLGKNNTKSTVKASQPLVERQLERLILTSKLVYNYDLRATSFYRTNASQDQLYAQGRTTVGRIITNAKGGQSLHNYGVAFDLVDRKKGYDIEWKKIWHMWNYITEGQGTWGGSWTNFMDKPHFENTLGYSLKDFQTGKVDYKKFK